MEQLDPPPAESRAWVREVLHKLSGAQTLNAASVYGFVVMV